MTICMKEGFLSRKGYLCCMEFSSNRIAQQISQGGALFLVEKRFLFGKPCKL